VACNGCKEVGVFLVGFLRLLWFLGDWSVIGFPSWRSSLGLKGQGSLSKTNAHMRRCSKRETRA
jgi:hypothetical protein